MTDTKSVNDTFLEIMSDLSLNNEPQCQSGNCAQGKIVCSHRAVARVYHRLCGTPPKLLCLNATMFNQRSMDRQIRTCIYCHNQGNRVLSEECWNSVPL